MSTDSHTTDIAERLNRLERKNRRLTGLAALPWLILAVIAFTAQSSTKGVKIVASSVAVKDKSGTVRASLGMHGNECALMLFDKAGGPVAKLDSAGMLTIFDDYPSQKSTVILGSDVAFYDGDKEVSYLNADGLGLHKEGAKVLAGIRADRGHARVFVGDQSGYLTVLGWMPLEQAETGEKTGRSAASITMLNPKKQLIWKAP